MMLDEEEKSDFQAKLEKHISDDKRNKNDSEETMLQARLSNVDLSINT